MLNIIHLNYAPDSDLSATATLNDVTGQFALLAVVCTPVTLPLLLCATGCLKCPSELIGHLSIYLSK